LHSKTNERLGRSDPHFFPVVRKFFAAVEADHARFVSTLSAGRGMRLAADGHGE